MLNKVDEKERNHDPVKNAVLSDKEPFMSDRQLAYFEQKLNDWKSDILQDNRDTLHYLHEESSQYSDNADRASAETDKSIELRTRDRQRKLIGKIEEAIGRIHDGSYGYCKKTGEPIGIRRLDARPIATLSIEAQELHERKEKMFRS